MVSKPMEPAEQARRDASFATQTAGNGTPPRERRGGGGKLRLTVVAMLADGICAAAEVIGDENVRAGMGSIAAWSRVRFWRNRGSRAGQWDLDGFASMTGRDQVLAAA